MTYYLLHLIVYIHITLNSYFYFIQLCLLIELWLILTEFVQNRDESAPCLQVLCPQAVQRDEEQRLLLKAVRGREKKRKSITSFR